jgi:DoxX-like protein
LATRRISPLAGAWKILGALAIVAPGLPRLKEWAYAGFFFELTAAAFSRASVGDSLADIIAPLGFLALVAASWALRPASRRLADGHRNRPRAALLEAPPAAAFAIR